MPSLLRLVLLAALWGGSFVLLRFIVPALGALPTAFARVLLAAVGLGLLLPAMRVKLRFGGKRAAAMGLGVINSGLPFVLYALAAHSLPAGYSAILNATTPLMGVLMGALLFGERITLMRLAGVLAGLAGVAVLARAGPVALTQEVLLGMSACLLATACYALAGFLTRQWLGAHDGLDSRVLAFGSQWGAVLALLPGLTWQLWHEPAAWTSWRHAPALVWWALLALGLLCTAFAYLLYFRLLADIGPVKTLTVTFLIPVFSLAWAWMLLGEKPAVAQAMGAALIGLALCLVLKPAPESGAKAGAMESRRPRA